MARNPERRRRKAEAEANPEAPKRRRREKAEAPPETPVITDPMDPRTPPSAGCRRLSQVSSAFTARHRFCSGAGLCCTWR